MSLRDFLLAILSGSFAIGPSIFLALEHLLWFARIAPQYKRWVVAVTSGLLGVLAWALALWLGYIEQPASYSPEYVANAFWMYGVMVGYSAFASATLIHGHAALSKQVVLFLPEDSK